MPSIPELKAYIKSTKDCPAYSHLRKKELSAMAINRGYTEDAVEQWRNVVVPTVAPIAPTIPPDRMAVINEAKKEKREREEKEEREKEAKDKQDKQDKADKADALLIPIEDFENKAEELFNEYKKIVVKAYGKHGRTYNEYNKKMIEINGNKNKDINDADEKWRELDKQAKNRKDRAIYYKYGSLRDDFDIDERQKYLQSIKFTPTQLKKLALGTFNWKQDEEAMGYTADIIWD
jgi:hypothetical protein